MEAILWWKTRKIFFEPLTGSLGAPLRLFALRVQPHTSPVPLSAVAATPSSLPTPPRSARAADKQTSQPSPPRFVSLTQPRGGPVPEARARSRWTATSPSPPLAEPSETLRAELLSLLAKKLDEPALCDGWC